MKLHALGHVHQYVPFLSEMLSKIRSGNSLSYSWNVGVGSNFLALYAYYMASPFNWLVALFPDKYLIEFMSYLVILKSASAVLPFPGILPGILKPEARPWFPLPFFMPCPAIWRPITGT